MTRSRIKDQDKGTKIRGGQPTIKDLRAVGTKPPRGWDPAAPTTKVVFA